MVTPLFGATRLWSTTEEKGFFFVDTTRLVAFLRTLGTSSGRSGVCVPSRVPSLESLGRRRTTFVLLLEYLTS
jgi:hypothetical protein